MPIAPGTASRSGCRRRGSAPRTRLTAFLVASLCTSSYVLGAGAAHAGDVAGSIEFKPNRLSKPPERNQGFLPRTENPLRPVKRIDPLPSMIVVLEDGPVSDADRVPAEQAVVYELLGASFAVPILPVLVGAQVELKNRGHDTPTLVTPEAPGVLDSVSLAPRAVHAFRVNEPLKPIVIRADGSPHLQGTVVAFPHRYFARVSERGDFEIRDVPPGDWTARVWYRTGWLEGVSHRVQVGPKRVTVTVEVSPELKVAP
jgi:hypothetical protein